MIIPEKVVAKMYHMAHKFPTIFSQVSNVIRPK